MVKSFIGTFIFAGAVLFLGALFYPMFVAYTANQVLTLDLTDTTSFVISNGEKLESNTGWIVFAGIGFGMMALGIPIYQSPSEVSDPITGGHSAEHSDRWRGPRKVFSLVAFVGALSCCILVALAMKGVGAFH
jgi:hypothetical protein